MRLALPLVALALAAGCDPLRDDVPRPRPYEFITGDHALRLGVGERLRARACVLFLADTDVGYGCEPVPPRTWRAADSTVAVVDANGVVTGRRAGRTEFVVEAHGFRMAMRVDVVAEPTAHRFEYAFVKDGGFDERTKVFYPGQPTTLLARVLNDEGRTLIGYPVEWTSSDTTVFAIGRGTPEVSEDGGSVRGAVARRVGRAVVRARMEAASVEAGVCVSQTADEYERCLKN